MFFIIGGIILLLTLVVGGVFAYQQYVSPQTISLDDSHMAPSVPDAGVLNNDSKTENNTAIKKVADVESDKMSEWESYSNNELGFSFKYPKEWQIVKNQGSNILLTIEKQLPESSINKEYCKPGIMDGGTDCYPKVSLEFSTIDKPADYISIEQSKPCEAFGECMRSETKYIPLEKAKIRLEYLQSDSTYPHTSFIDLSSMILRVKGYAPSSKNCVGSSCPKYVDSQEVIRSAQEITQILSTFEFVEEEQTDGMSDWEKFEDKISGVNFKHPANYSIETMARDDGSGFTYMFKPDYSIQISVYSKYSKGQAEFFMDTSSNDQITIGNNIWKTYYLPTGYGDGGAVGSGKPLFGLQTELSNQLIKVSLHDQSEANEDVQKILSTLKLN